VTDNFENRDAGVPMKTAKGERNAMRDIWKEI
jgi:hypothetical protein